MNFSDIRIPLVVAREACKREGVLIAPPLPYGISPCLRAPVIPSEARNLYFTAYPGTLSLRPETFAAVIREVIEGLLVQGFRRALVSNDHGGNTGLVSPLLVELGNPSRKLPAFGKVVHDLRAAPGGGCSGPGGGAAPVPRQLVGEFPLYPRGAGARGGEGTSGGPRHCRRCWLPGRAGRWLLRRTVPGSRRGDGAALCSSGGGDGGGAAGNVADSEWRIANDK